MYTIELYDTDAGACPVGEFLLALGDRANEQL